jgi:hypothetical protein
VSVRAGIDEMGEWPTVYDFRDRRYLARALPPWPSPFVVHLRACRSLSVRGCGLSARWHKDSRDIGRGRKGSYQ